MAKGQCLKVLQKVVMMWSKHNNAWTDGPWQPLNGEIDNRASTSTARGLSLRIPTPQRALHVHPAGTDDA